MILIAKEHSHCKISGVSPQQLKDLRAILSYKIEANYFAGGFPQTKYLLDKRGNFPTGLLPEVEAYLDKSKVEYYTHLSYPKPLKPANLLLRSPFGVNPRDSQLEAVSRAVELERGIIQMPTGSGKSLVIALIAAYYNVRTLVVVPRLEIKEQLLRSFKEVFHDISDITIENIDSRSLINKKDYDLLIIDEAHHVAAKTYQKLNKDAWNNIRYRFFMTATPFRTNSEENMLMKAITGDIIYKLTYEEAVMTNQILPIEAFYVEIPKKSTNSTTWSQVYSELVVNNSARNDIIAGLMLQIDAILVAQLILVKEIAHGKKLSQMTGVPFASGQDENTAKYIKDFNSGKIKALIGTTGVLGEGVDTKPCEYVIIAGLGKSKSAFMQQVGRAVRIAPGKRSAKVILIKDQSHKYLLRHFREQVKILAEEYGVEIQKL